MIVRNRRQTFEAVVDITGEAVLSLQGVEGVESGFLLSEEWSIGTRTVMANQDWRGALARRGITSLEDVVCVPNSVGYFGTPEEAGRRLVRVVCFQSADTENFWGRPIEGLIAVVDLPAREVVRIIDTGAVPIPAGPVDFDEASVGELRDPPNAFSIVQPDGPSFEVDRQMITWQKWQFHFRIDPAWGSWFQRFVMTTTGTHGRCCTRVPFPNFSYRTWIRTRAGISRPTWTRASTAWGNSQWS